MAQLEFHDRFPSWFELAGRRNLYHSTPLKSILLEIWSLVAVANVMCLLKETEPYWLAENPRLRRKFSGRFLVRLAWVDARPTARRQFSGLAPHGAALTPYSKHFVS